MIGAMSSLGGNGGSWTLLTGHGHVLVEIARNPKARMRDISAAVGLTERTVQAIVTDLEAAGYLTRDRDGRRNRYTVNPDSSFRHSAQEGLRVGPFLDFLATGSNIAATGSAADADADRSQAAETPPSRKPRWPRHRNPASAPGRAQQGP